MSLTAKLEKIARKMALRKQLTAREKRTAKRHFAEMVRSNLVSPAAAYNDAQRAWVMQKATVVRGGVKAKLRQEEAAKPTILGPDGTPISSARLELE